MSDKDDVLTLSQLSRLIKKLATDNPEAWNRPVATVSVADQPNDSLRGYVQALGYYPAHKVVAMLCRFPDPEDHDDDDNPE